jgi:antitoxin component of MazEF toxin-antitoxin module
MAMQKARAPKVGSSDARMARLTEGLPTKAAKIRKLGAAGYKRQAIADFLGISYQHVRNVLRRPIPLQEQYASASPHRAAVAEMADRDGSPDANVLHGDPPLVTLRVRPDGSVRLPPEVLRALLAEPGDYITASIERGELVLMSPDAVLRRVREWRRRPVPKARSAVDQFLIERRREGAAEDAELKKWAKSS